MIRVEPPLPRPSDRLPPTLVRDGLTFVLENPASAEELGAVLKALKRRKAAVSPAPRPGRGEVTPP